jgi:ferredoxin
VVERNRGTPTWEEFVKLVNQRFRPPLQGNALGELIQLCQTSSVVEYQNKFLSLVTRCEGLIEKHQVDIFTAGLGNPLKTNVELEHPATLEDAMALARTYEQRLMDESAGRNPPPACAACMPQASSKLLPLTGPPLQGDTGRPTTPRFKRLTPAEMAAKRECGECYNCIEKFSHEHLKVCPVKGVFLLQMEEDDLSMEETEVDPLISLNAITGISQAETLQLHEHKLAVKQSKCSFSEHRSPILDM